jgi:hypothetical protein
MQLRVYVLQPLQPRDVRNLPELWRRASTPPTAQGGTLDSTWLSVEMQMLPPLEISGHGFDTAESDLQVPVRCQIIIAVRSAYLTTVATPTATP